MGADYTKVSQPGGGGNSPSCPRANRAGEASNGRAGLEARSIQVWTVPWRSGSLCFGVELFLSGAMPSRCDLR